MTRRPPAFPAHPAATSGARRWRAGAPVVLWAAALLGASAPAHADATGFVWPLAPPHPLLRGFVAPEHDWSPGHRGVDLGAEAGAAVLAAGDGTVAYAGVLAGRGVVTVAHRGGLRSTYEPLVVEVRPGQQVQAGERIGRLALADGHCLPRACLHWGAIRDGYLDPLTLLGLHRPVRLLPVWGSAGRPPPGTAGDVGPPPRVAAGAPEAGGPAHPKAPVPSKAPERSPGSGPTGRVGAVGAVTLAGAAATAVAMRRRKH